MYVGTVAKLFYSFRRGGKKGKRVCNYCTHTHTHTHFCTIQYKPFNTEKKKTTLEGNRSTALSHTVP